MSRTTTLLIDGNSVAYTINVNEYPTEKKYARKFFAKLRDYTHNLPPNTRMILFFDNKVGGTWRNNLYPDYQKDRVAKYEKYTEAQKKESAIRSQNIAYIKEQIEKSNKFNYISYPHTETDDMISLYCHNIQKDDETVIIVTTDKDLFQLITNNVNRKRIWIYFLVKYQMIKDDKEGKKILEDKIMLGDKSDSIPPVCKGVGKTYYPDFKIFLEKMKETKTDPTDREKAKKVCESLGIKYINSFSNFNAEQLAINKKLVDLNYVADLDEHNFSEKTKYIESMLDSAIFSPYALYSIKLA